VRRFFDSILDEVLAKVFLVLDPRAAMASGRRHHVPLFHHFGVGVGLFRRVRTLRAEQFPTGLVPIGVGEFIRVALGNERDLAGALLDFIGRRRAEAITMNRDFACRMSRYEGNMPAVCIELMIIRLAAGKGNLVFRNA